MKRLSLLFTSIFFIISFNSFVLAQEQDVSAAPDFLKTYFASEKSLTSEINSVLKEIDEQKNGVHEGYQGRVDQPLDELLLRVSFVLGVTKIEGLQEKCTGVEALKDVVLEKLAQVDTEYINASKISVESNKLNLNIADNIDSNLTNKNLKQLEENLKAIKAILQKMEDLMVKELDDLFKKIEDQIKSINELLDLTVEQDENINKEEIDLEEKDVDAKQDEQEQDLDLEEEKTPIKKVRDIKKNKIEIFFDKLIVIYQNTTEKVRETFENFLRDVKERALELKNK